jgi:MFS family permease
MGHLAAARALQGLGGGGMMRVTQALIADIIAPRAWPLPGLFRRRLGVREHHGPNAGRVLCAIPDVALGLLDQLADWRRGAVAMHPRL